MKKRAKKDAKIKAERESKEKVEEWIKEYHLKENINLYKQLEKAKQDLYDIYDEEANIQAQQKEPSSQDRLYE